MSKFILDGVNAKPIKGIMSNPKKLQAYKKHFTKANKKAFDEYDAARRKALVLARNTWLD